MRAPTGPVLRGPDSCKCGGKKAPQLSASLMDSNYALALCRPASPLLCTSSCFRSAPGRSIEWFLQQGPRSRQHSCMR